MGCYCRPHQQCLDPAEARGVLRKSEPADEFLCRLDSTAKLETQYSAEAGKQLIRAAMTRMARQPCVSNARNGILPFEKLRYLQRAFVLVSHPHGQRLQASTQQKARMRIQAAAEMVQEMRDLIYKVAASDYSAGYDVVVAAEVFCGAVESEIKPERTRLEIDGGGESIVDNRHEAVLTRKLHCALQIPDLQ